MIWGYLEKISPFKGDGSAPITTQVFTNDRGPVTCREFSGIYSTIPASVFN